MIFLAVLACLLFLTELLGVLQREEPLLFFGFSQLFFREACLERSGYLWETGGITVSRVLFRERELTEFCGKLGEFCEKLGEFCEKHKIIG